MTNGHATLAPSAAHRWFECPGSIRMSAGLSQSSRFADEGTAAHMMAQACLTQNLDADEYPHESITVREGVTFDVTPDMIDAVQCFLDHVRIYLDQDFELSIETKLDLDHLWPGQFGTGDAVLYKASDGDLHVVDFKYGIGVPVYAAENPQLLSYASGAAHRYHNRGVSYITIHVVQPRIPGKAPIDSWTTTPQRLMQFEDEFREKAERTALPNAPLKAGPWCQFCPASGMCPAFRDQAMNIAQAEFDVLDQLAALPKVENLSPDALGKLLSEINQVEAWCAAAREYAYQCAVEGQMPTGFKLVGKRATRRWIDDNKAAAALNTIYDLTANEIYTRKIVSPAQAEKLIGKRDAKALQTLVSKFSSGVTLAPLSDKREAVAVSAIHEFLDQA